MLNIDVLVREITLRASESRKIPVKQQITVDTATVLPGSTFGVLLYLLSATI